MARVKTNLTLEPMTLGILHLLVDVGETDSLFQIVDLLVQTYGESYVETNELDFDEFKQEALDMFHRTRRPQSTKSKEQQQRDAKKSISRLNIKKRTTSSLDDRIIDTSTLGDDF